jgi:hypothetical protein
LITARIGSTHGDLNLTNVLVTFIKREDSRDLDPRCWLIDYGRTRLDGHTGRDFAQLEMGIREEVLAPAYVDLCRRLTAAEGMDRDQAHALILSYHWAFEEQLVRYDSAWPAPSDLDTEFETVAIGDAILPMVAKFGEDKFDITRRIAVIGDGAGPELRQRITDRAGELLSADRDYARIIFVYVSTSRTLRRCYSILRHIRNIALAHGHGRLEQMWAQMLVGLSVLKREPQEKERLSSLEREVVSLATVVAADEIRWNLRPEAKALITEMQADGTPLCGEEDR